MYLWYNTIQFNLFQEESVPRVPPHKRVCDRAVQNTPGVYYTVGIKYPAAGFFITESCCRVVLYIFTAGNQQAKPYDGDRRPEAIIFSEPVAGGNRWIGGLYAHSRGAV
jgi:hypothetical protein